MNVSSFSKDELLALLGRARQGRERDWLLFLVAFHHGLRVSEVVHIKRDDIASGFLTVKRLKGSNRTTQELVAHENPLLNERSALFDYVRGMRGNQRLFPIGRKQVWRLIQKYGKQAGIAEHKLHPHALKHSIAMQTIQSAGIENVRVHLGHKSISSTGEYLKVSEADAGRAVQKALKD